MKVSEITIDDVQEYINCYDEDKKKLQIFIDASKSYIRGYTGLTDEQIDEHEEFTVAIMVLCNEMFENRGMSVNSDKANKLITSILDMYSVNLL